MQSIDTLNMLDKARDRAGKAAGLVSMTREMYNISVSKSMFANAKRLKAQLRRQEMALGIANEEVRELEAALAAEGDLVTQANGKKQK